MSELSLEGQESKTVPYCHDRPPQYDSCQPSQDVLTSVIENEHTRRVLLQRLDKLGTDFLDLVEEKLAETDYLRLTEVLLEMSRLYTDGTQIATKLANVYKECTFQNTELCIAMSRLTVSEFNRTYTSLKRDPPRQMRHKLAQGHEDRGDCYNRDCGCNSQRSLGTQQIGGAGDCSCNSPCSCDQFIELSAKVDKINDKLGQSLQSHVTANISKKTTDLAPAQPSRSLWKRILKHSARP